MHKSLATMALFIASLTTAQAQPLANDSARLRITRSDLSTPDGIAALRVRIRAAVKEVCARGGTPVNYTSLQADTCERATQADADRQLEARLRAVSLALRTI